MQQAQQEQNSIRNCARRYAEHGWSVIPLTPRDKHPPLVRWTPFQTEPASPDEIASWFDKWPDANIAIVTGALSGLVVVDLDSQDAEDWFTAEFGDIRTITALSARGRHLYFAHPGEHIPTKRGVAPGVDVRGDGGYIVAPPSIHSTGTTYRWDNSSGKTELAPLPAGIIELARKRGGGERSSTTDTACETEPPRTIGVGARNDTLTQLAGRLLGSGQPRENVLEQCLAMNRDECTPPLPASEVEIIVRSIARREATRQKAAAKTQAAAPQPLVAIRFSDVLRREVQWLWKGYIPLGKLTVLDGDPGLGKSTLTLDLAARVSTGRAMPDDTEGVSGSVLVVSYEDSGSDTVRPRLEAMGADLNRVCMIDGHQLTIPDDIGRLEVLLRELDARLLIIDPLAAAMSVKVNSWNDQHVRAALAQLFAAVEASQTAVTAVRHLNKKEGQSALYRGGGSIGLIGAARAGFLVARDPDDLVYGRILASTKSNLAASPPSLRFRIVSADGASSVEWAGTSELTADSLLQEEAKTPVGEAVQFLTSILASGPKPTREVEEAAATVGIKPRTMDRARKKLNVTTSRTGFGGGSAWLMSLPTSTTALNQNLASFVPPTPGSPENGEERHNATMGHGGT